MDHNTATIQVNPVKIRNVLLIVAAILTGLNGLTWYLNRHGFWKDDALVRMFNLNSEANIPTTFSILLLAAITLILLLNALRARAERNPHTTSWFFLTYVFLYICLDEGSTLHERLDPLMRTIVGVGPFGIFNFAWVAILIVLLPLLGFLLLRFFLHLPRDTQKIFLLAAAVYIAGGFGMEMVGGVIALQLGRQSRYFFLAYTIEELLEMTGQIIFLYGLFLYTFRDGYSLLIRKTKQATQLKTVLPE
jgi:hypothetical protein